MGQEHNFCVNVRHAGNTINFRGQEGHVFIIADILLLTINKSVLYHMN